MKKPSVWNEIKTYGMKSVFYNYVLSSMLTILLIFVPFCILIYTYYDYILTQEIAKQATINTLQSKNIFDNLTEDFHRNYNLACSSGIVRKFLTASTLDGQTGRAIVEDTKEFINTLLKSSNQVSETYIYSFNTSISLSSGEKKHITQNDTYEWLRTYRATKLPFIMFPRKENSEDFNYIYICSEITEKNKVIGLFCTKMYYDKFTDIVLQSFIKRPDKIFIVSNIGLILYSDDKSLINTLMFEKDDTYTAFNSAKNVNGNSIVYKDYIIAIAKSTSSQLLIMSYIHKNSIGENYKFIRILLMSGAFVILLTSVCLAFFFSYRHYRAVANVMRLLEKPDMLDKKPGLINEFFYIANSISDISQKNETISNELTEKMYLLKNAQIAALQAQINPHFLFNTLQLINLSIIKEVKGDTISTQLISQLATLVRLAYDTKNYIVTVSEEIETTQIYLNIQQARYNSRLNIDFDIAEECLSCKTVKLILQPLVENSIVHGFKGKDSPWNISVRCYLESDFLVYEISDNGTGMDTDTINMLNSILNQNKTDRSTRVGVANVNQRLKLIFGRKCCMSVCPNTAGPGTKIVIKHIVNNLL